MCVHPWGHPTHSISKGTWGNTLCIVHVAFISSVQQMTHTWSLVCESIIGMVYFTAHLQLPWRDNIKICMFELVYSLSCMQPCWMTHKWKLIVGGIWWDHPVFMHWAPSHGMTSCADMNVHSVHVSYMWQYGYTYFRGQKKSWMRTTYIFQGRGKV